MIRDLLLLDLMKCQHFVDLAMSHLNWVLRVTLFMLSNYQQLNSMCFSVVLLIFIFLNDDQHVELPPWGHLQIWMYVHAIPKWRIINLYKQCVSLTHAMTKVQSMTRNLGIMHDPSGHNMAKENIKIWFAQLDSMCANCNCRCLAFSTDAL